MGAFEQYIKGVILVAVSLVIMIIAHTSLHHTSTEESSVVERHPGHGVFVHANSGDAILSPIDTVYVVDTVYGKGILIDATPDILTDAEKWAPFEKPNERR